MVQGLADFQRRWGSLPSRVRGAVIETRGQNADELVAFMKWNAPEKEGALIASIGWTWGSAPEGSMALGSMQQEDLTITVYAGNESTMVTNKRGVKFQNAKLQEFGTKNMPANPYFYVAWRALRRRHKSRLTRNVNKAIKSA